MIKKFKVFYLIGAGGYGAQLSIFLKKNKIAKSVIFVDDQYKLNISSFFKKKNLKFNITIGNPKIREQIYLKSLTTGLKYQTIIFSNKNIYTKNINKGCVIEPNIMITNNVAIGIGNFIFSGSVIGHDACIGNFCNIGCNVVIAGNVVIANRVQIGANSFVSNNTKICSDAVIAPGSIVMNDIKAPGIYKDNVKIK